MTVTNTLRWRGHSSAGSTTTYRIASDYATPNTYATLVASQAATSPYTPATTTLDGAIEAGDTTLTMTSATSFANAEYIVIDREMFLLAGKSTNTFSGVTGGVYNTVKRDHPDLSNIYKAHETYAHTGVTFGSRHVIRYRVYATLTPGSTELVAAELVAVSYTPPTTNDKITVWGNQDKLDGTPHAGVTVTMNVQDKAFNPGTAESIDTEQLSTTTDASGYWEFTTHKDVAKAGGGAITITIGGTPYVLASLPDLDGVCFLECL